MSEGAFLSCSWDYMTQTPPLHPPILLPPAAPPCIQTVLQPFVGKYGGLEGSEKKVKFIKQMKFPVRHWKEVMMPQSSIDGENCETCY